MHYRIFPTLLAAVSLTLSACGNSSDMNSGQSVVFRPPNSAFADGLGITNGPITADQAKAIATAAAGGTALSVEQEDEDGTQVFGVKIQTAKGNKDVKVRISDGAVTKIDSDDGSEGAGGPED